jgi:hypothetical protein
MIRRTVKIALAAAGALIAAGCANDSNGLLSTASLGSSPASTTTAAAPAKYDPACVSLTARIDALRKEGVVERVGKASTGNTAMVSVKRESLAKMTELDKANAEFQTKCGVLMTTASNRPAPPATVAAATTPPPSAAPPAATAKPAAKP